MTPALSARPLRIEMVVPTMEPGGMEVVVARLTRALAARGHDVGVTCTIRGDLLGEELRADGFLVTVVPTPGWRANVRAPALDAWFRERGPDVVHAHSGVWLKAAAAARRAGVRRVIHTAHGLLDREPWHGIPLKRLAARHTDAVVTVSDPLLQYFLRRVGLDPRSVSMVANGVDTDSFAPGPHTGRLRAALGIAPERLVVGNVARLAPGKNHALLLDAFALVRRERGDASLVIVGDGAQRGALAARAAEPDLAPDAHLAGVMRDVAAVYRDFDLFVLSSDAEGTSMSILEAMASGVPVVATDVGGNAALLDAGRCGLLVPPRDPAALAAAIGRMLADGALRARLAAAARERVLERYSEAAMLECYEALYYADGPGGTPGAPPARDASRANTGATVCAE